MMARFISYRPAAALLVASLCWAATTSSTMAQAPACAAYRDAVRSSTSSFPTLLRDYLITDPSATECLIKIISEMNDGAATATPSPLVRNQFLSATNALRAIITKNNADDANLAKSNGDGPQLRKFINAFRNADNLEAISVLTFGARSETYEVRSNSLLILANVIDNTSVCVPLDHFSDPTLGKVDLSRPANDYPIRGRANLLAVISVVAPWAYEENYNLIFKVWKDLDGVINKADPNLTQTANILANLKARLDSQGKDTNRNASLPPALKQQCAKYKPRFLPPKEWPYSSNK
ncbi:MAG: hypothetical protein HZA66_05750 [Rhodopseudomonas palustris]|uniref:Uncharacterized protein n=1 Tax=Rhodopseudomonas palustris TaxID=1076 RepID=A0A933RVD1_RHOPL|nr:hypothetical protein [Rhodopseudomonas palustris]